MCGLFPPTVAQKGKQSSGSAERKGTALLPRHQTEEVRCPGYCRTALKPGFQEPLKASDRRIPFSIY